MRGGHTRVAGTILIGAVLLALAISVEPASAEEAVPDYRFALELETGPVWQSRNDVRIPNDATGTRFSIADILGSGAWPAGRLYLTWNMNARHRLRALAAPLSITETGALSSQTSFAGAAYEADVRTEATYKFNSWRLTYAYRVHRSPRWAWRIGLTSKIRDAKVELKQGGTSSRKTDVGFVPLLHVGGTYWISKHWQLILDADALAGGPGRAEDVALKSRFALTDRLSLSAGYRTVEGGADVDEVYSFAWFHYGLASMSYRF